MQRHKSLQRILKVQDDLRRRSEAQLMALQQRAQALLKMEEHILDSLTRGDPQDGALARMAGDRLRWLDRDLNENGQAQRVSKAQLLEAQMRKLTCARLEKNVRKAYEAETERRALQDEIDRHSAGPASFE